MLLDLHDGAIFHLGYPLRGTEQVCQFTGQLRSSDSVTMLLGGMITYHEDDGSCPPSSLGVDAKGITYMGSLVSRQIKNALRQHED